MRPKPKPRFLSLDEAEQNLRVTYLAPHLTGKPNCIHELLVVAGDQKAVVSLWCGECGLSLNDKLRR
jgi:hypothetical protein